ncbi:helix-turn-helix domain-containing protein [Diplocloster agilis]|nr:MULTISPECIES: helix-turn-helix transcriptional regulator [Lachnospiraceae]MCU6733598.1 helix-turn-helix domain-containing protein [Suonthocola fibrivorans]SCI99611.1 anaerobic benzoate catabolism transcriptional regulator [uncultured Clostridium sp.]
MELIYKQMAKNIKNLRVSKGLSQEKLAELVGVTPNYIYRLETGHKKMSLNCLLSILNALDISVDQIIPAKSTQEDYELSEVQDQLLNIVKGCDENEIAFIMEHMKNLLYELHKYIKH